MKLLELVLSKKKQLLIILFITYSVFVVWMTLLMREPRTAGRVFEPRLFWAFRSWLIGNYYGKAESIQYFPNILFFIPFGFLFPRKKWIQVCFAALFTSTVIEASQYIFNLGWCEIDDVISNTTGAMIGFSLRGVLEKTYRKIRGKKLCRLKKH